MYFISFLVNGGTTQAPSVAAESAQEAHQLSGTVILKVCVHVHVS